MLLWVMSIAGLALAVRPATAQVAYEFANATTGTAQTLFTVLAGQTVPIRVYIHDNGVGAPTLNANGGLATGAVRVTYNNAAVANVQLSATNPSAAVPPWSFGNSNNSNATSAVLNNLSFAPVLPDAQGRILLGQFTFTGVSGGTVTLTMGDPNPTNNTDNTYFNGGAGLDSLIGPGTPATLTVTVIPEPGSLLLGSLAAAGLVAIRRRTRRTVAVETA
jgi:hypothetical protein